MIFTPNEWIEIIAAALGTLGFGVLFNIRGKKLLVATLGGFLAWMVFIMLGWLIANEPVRYFIVSVVTSVYSEVFARIMKTPRTTFWIVCLIPLVPGSALYYTMSYALNNSMANFMTKALYTLELSAALSLGIVVVAAASRSIVKMQMKKHQQMHRAKQQENQ